ncbi:MAG: hypothetical protein RIR11_3179, partial [Bacteroidota bacterium]
MIRCLGIWCEWLGVEFRLGFHPITKTIPNLLQQIYYFCRAIGVLLLLQGR